MDSMPQEMRRTCRPLVFGAAPVTGDAAAAVGPHSVSADSSYVATGLAPSVLRGWTV
jgi:hypothetical protein